MPAVHHKLLLEDALQDSPQVGACLRVFFTRLRTQLSHNATLLALKLAC